MKDIKKLRYNNYDTSSLLRLFHNTQTIDAIGTCVSNMGEILVTEKQPQKTLVESER